MMHQTLSLMGNSSSPQSLEVREPLWACLAWTCLAVQLYSPTTGQKSSKIVQNDDTHAKMLLFNKLMGPAERPSLIAKLCIGTKS